MSERILLTGAAGFIGSHVARALLSRGDSVIGIDNFDPFYARFLKEANLIDLHDADHFSFIEADCSTLLADPDAFSDVDAIVHLAAKAGVRPSIEDPLAYTRANVLATQAMLELAKQSSIDRFIFGSSSSVYGNNESVPFSESDDVSAPISPYAATKRASELAVHVAHSLEDLSAICLRFFTVYGPRQRPDLAIRKFSELMLRSDPIPVYGDGSSERDYTWVGDIVDGVLRAIDRTRIVRSYDIINLGGHQTTSLTRLIDLLADALNVEPRIDRLPMQPGDVTRTYADISNARNLLGWEPSTPIEDGIPRFADWMRHTPHTQLTR